MSARSPFFCRDVEGVYRRSVVEALIDRIQGMATKRAGRVAQYPEGSCSALRMDLTGQVNSAAGSELVTAVLAGKAATAHLNQITDCKSLLSIDSKLRTGFPLRYHQRSLMACRETEAEELRWHKAHPERRDEVYQFYGGQGGVDNKWKGNDAWGVPCWGNQGSPVCLPNRD